MSLPENDDTTTDADLADQSRAMRALFDDDESDALVLGLTPHGADELDRSPPPLVVEDTFYRSVGPRRRLLGDVIPRAKTRRAFEAVVVAVVGLGLAAGVALAVSGRSNAPDRMTAPVVPPVAVPERTPVVSEPAAPAPAVAPCTANTAALREGESDPASAEQDTTHLKATSQRALEQGRIEDARQAAALACDRDARDADAWLLLGASEQAQGNALAARAAFVSCVQSATHGDVGECRALAR
jgi:hypothetical protein